MKIAVAQIKPVKGDIAENIKLHKRIIQMALPHQVDAIFFPELSVTGYEPELVEQLATDIDDLRFDAFQQISNTSHLTIGLGMPIRTISGIQIGMIVFQPGQPRKVYAKQQLHTDELMYFTAGEHQMILTIGDEQIAPAICYESLQPEHAEQAVKLGATIYLASVAKSQNGIDKAETHYPRIAKKWSVLVLMSNCVGPSDNFISIGQSAIWSKEGNLLKQLDSTSEGLLIYDTVTEQATATM